MSNTGYGGEVKWIWCCVQDGIKLAQALAAAGGLDATPAALAAALRSYEHERTARAAPVISKSHAMGRALQLRNPLVRHATAPAQSACCGNCMCMLMLLACISAGHPLHSPLHSCCSAIM